MTPAPVDYLNPALPAGLSRVRMPGVDATDEALRGYGRLVDDAEACRVEIVRWPARIRRGSVSQQVMTSMDWLPTLSGASGAYDGENLMGVLTGTEPVRPRKLFWRYKAAEQAAAAFASAARTREAGSGCVLAHCGTFLPLLPIRRASSAVWLARLARTVDSARGS